MNFVLAIIKGFSQLLFQENIILGLLMIVGLGIAFPMSLMLALVGNISSILAAFLIGAPKGIVETGVYGFNGILIGTMVAFYVKQTPIALLITVVGSIFAAIIFFILTRNNVHPFAFPFVLVAWIILILIKLLKIN